MSIETSHIGMMIVDLINDHAAACEDDEMPAFCHTHDPQHPVPGATFESCEAQAPEGDYSNVLVTLSTGAKFRVQVFAR